MVGDRNRNVALNNSTFNLQIRAPSFETRAFQVLNDSLRVQLSTRDVCGKRTVTYLPYVSPEACF